MKMRPAKRFQRKSKIFTFFKCLIKTTNEYITVSSISGLKYVQSERTYIAIKLFWCVVLIVSFILCNILVAHFWLRYKSNSTRMTVASNHIPLTSLKLPAITFCSVNLIDSTRLESFIEKHNLQANYSREELFRIFQQSSGFFMTTNYNTTELDLLQRIADANHYSIRDMMDMVQTSCDETFERCHLEGQLTVCSNLFTPVTSQYGNCCTFNNKHQHEANSSFSTIGQRTISLFLRPNLETFVSSEGLRLLVYESNTSASTSLSDNILSRQTETMVELTPEINACSEEVGQTPIDQRNCLYEGERKLKYFSDYRELNCRLECILADIENTCQCLPYYYSTYSTTKVCRFPEIKCLVDRFWSTPNETRKDAKKCSCMSNCVELSYQAVISETELRANNVSVGSFYDGLTSDHMVVHISFGNQVYKSTRLDLSTNILSLTANLGGTYS